MGSWFRVWGKKSLLVIVQRDKHRVGDGQALNSNVRIDGRLSHRFQILWSAVQVAGILFTMLAYEF